MSHDVDRSPDAGTPRDDEEALRLADDVAGRRDWRLWGTYLPERQWGTVREDYSADGDAWASFPYAASRARAYRWSEDGLLGWTDRDCRLCLSTALWNGRDDHLKERLFGLGNADGNHGEEVKELYYYLDATPTGSYAKALYKYPQAAFPYAELVQENGRRGLGDPEYELLDTGIFDENRYFDVLVEYAKRDADDTLVRITVSNRGPEAAAIVVLPTLTLRNTWSWSEPTGDDGTPRMAAAGGTGDVIAEVPGLGTYRFAVVPGADGPTAERMFTENESNLDTLAGSPGRGRAKDAFHRVVVGGDASATGGEDRGTKTAFLFRQTIEAGASLVLRLRLARDEGAGVGALDVEAFEGCLARRIAEADDFYAAHIPDRLGAEARAVARQAYAGLLWSKQVYAYDVDTWIVGDPGRPPPADRAGLRNGNWRHMSLHDVISMPDKWEYPWFAAWDLAFHLGPMARIDPAFAKSQLLLMLNERCLHPNGALPAYEWNFDDVNPPVHAAAVLDVFTIDRRQTGKADIDFLERAFQKLVLNFTWWVNRNDDAGNDLFGGGFLGLDNIGLFDRSLSLKDGTTLNQADATAWMGLFCSSMLTIAIELAQVLPVYEDMALKFFHHDLLVIDAINGFGGSGLWDEEDGFFYDQLVIGDGAPVPVKVQSIVGLVPLFAVCAMRRDQHDRLPGLVRQIEEGLAKNPRFAAYVARTEVRDGPYADAWFVALTPKDRLLRLLDRMLDEDQFLSPHGIRSVSKRHADHPLHVRHDGKDLEVDYVPGEGNSRMFGGNSNWRGPIWFPINILIVQALERFHTAYGDELKVECPTGTGVFMNLKQVSEELSRRLSSLFLPDTARRRPCHGEEYRYSVDPYWHELVLFYEHFHGETGRGLGASHQTGWTATVISCLERASQTAA